MTSTNAVDLKAVPFAQAWETRILEKGEVLLTHPNNMGSMMYVPDKGIVMVMSKQNPTQIEIAQGISFHLRYADFSQPLVERLLEAENNALSNNRTPATQCISPFAVFEYLNGPNRMVAVIQCTHHLKWVIMEDQADLAKLEAAISIWNKPGVPQVEQLSAKNVIKLHTNNWAGNFYVIKRAGDSYWRSIVVQSGHSMSGAFDDMFSQAPMDNDVEYGVVFCHTCSFETAYMHWRYDLGDKMKELESAWNDHRDTGCSTPRLSYL